MNKYIEKVTLKIVQRMEENRKEFVEAERNYQDTGHNSYYKKMNKLDNEYEELKNFLTPEPELEVTPEDLIELDRLREILKNVKSKVFYMENDFPGNSHLIGLKELLRDL